MSTRIQFRRGTAAQWVAANPVLASGEPGVETDTSRFKLGDGATAWAALPAVQSNVFVQEAQPVMTLPGLWVELNPDGSVKTMWIGTT